jgi:urease accessory protein
MGSRTTRITAQDFLIPPEFRSYRLAERSAGQIGGVSLTLADRAGKTILDHTYQQVPLRVMPPFNFKGEPAALIYFLLPTAGLMDGDGHLVELLAEPGSTAVVTGQSANRVHPALGSFATQQWNIRIKSGARLVILPGPTIPFEGCRYYQRIRLDLEGDARLIWGDIWLPGRYDRGDLSEFYQFDRVVQDLEVRRDGGLIYRDRFQWKGPWDRATARWFVGDGAHAASASLFITGEVPGLGHERTPSLPRAVLSLERGDTLIRWCGSAPDLVPAVVDTALRCAAGWAPGQSPGPWLTGGYHLNPSHWFSVHTERS